MGKWRSGSVFGSLSYDRGSFLCRGNLPYFQSICADAFFAMGRQEVARRKPFLQHFLYPPLEIDVVV